MNFLQVKVDLILYNCLTILMALILIIFSVNMLKSKNENKIFPILLLIIAPILLAVGVISFFIDKKYYYIPLLAMIIIAFLVIFVLIKYGKKEKEDNQNEK